MADKTKHQYDVDLKEIYKLYNERINAENVISQHPKEYLIEQLKINIDFQCEHLNVDFEKAVYIVLTEKDNDIYWQYLMLFLLVVKEHRIELIIEWHLAAYSRTKSEFINQIEFVVLNTMEWADVFENKNRLNKIARWIKTNRRAIREDTVKLKWLNEHSTILENLSTEIFRLRYTRKDEDFHSVFVNGKVITWKGTVEGLVYLIHRFHSSPYKYITTSKGDKPVWKGVEGHFKFYDDEDNLVFKKQLRDVLHNVIKRFPKKYTETITIIDRLVKRSTR